MSTKFIPQVLPRTAFICILILGILSCGSDDPTVPVDNPDAPLNISLAVSNALPGQEVAITGMPADIDLTGVYGLVTDGQAGTGKAEPWTTEVGGRQDGTFYLVAPLRMDDPLGGGPVRVRLAGGGVTSNEVMLDIDALPAATVTMQDLVGGLQDLLSSWLVVHGTTREELRAMDPATMSPQFYPLWHAHEILDSPDNPHSMRATVDGPVAFFDNEVLDFDVTNRMLSLTGAVPFLGTEVVSVDSLAGLEDPTAATLAGGVPVRDRSAKAGSAALDGCIPAGTYGISTGSQLDIAMTKARAAASRLEGFTGDVLSKWSSTARAAGVVPALKGGATVVSGGLYVFKLVNEAAANLLPTSFDYEATVLKLADDDTEYNEDDTGGFWQEFKVTGVSQGWVLDEDALNAALKVGKFGDLGGLQTEELLSGGLNDLERNFVNYVVTEGTKFLIAEATEGTTILEVCPGRWPGIDVSSSIFCESEITFGTSVEMTSHTFFETREPGNSQLKVQTLDTRFGGAPPAAQRADIEVTTITVEVTPSQVVMEPSEVQTFDAVVTNASDDSVEWFVPSPYLELERQDFGKTIVIQAPPESANWTDPVSLVARSQANTGSREGMVDLDPRENAALLLAEAPDSVQIQISPSYICITPGDTTSFTPVVSGIEDPTIIWSIVEGYGSINQDGVYQSLAGGTSDTVIMAEVEGHPEAIDTARVRASGCTCAFEISVVGASFYEGAGGDIAYLFQDLPDGFHGYQFFVMLEDNGENPANFSMFLGPTDDGPAPRPGQTGTYEVGFSYIEAGSQNSWIAPDSSATVLLNILEHTETYMVANFSGVAVRGEGQDRTTVSVSGSFRAGMWDFGRWPCE